VGGEDYRAQQEGREKVFGWRILLQSLAMLRNVEAFQLLFAGFLQRREGAHPSRTNVTRPDHTGITATP
jgi:hypothetical protein